MILKQFFLSRSSLLSLPFRAETLVRCISVTCAVSNRNMKIVYEKDLRENSCAELPDIVEYARDRAIIYSSYVSKNKVSLSYIAKKALGRKIKTREKWRRQEESIPLIVERMISQDVNHEIIAIPAVEDEKLLLNLPFSSVEEINTEYLESKIDRKEKDITWNESQSNVQDEIERRLVAYDAGLFPDFETSLKNPSTEEYINMEELTIEGSDDESLGLGSCDQEIPISNIPCGGCGARLHCQEHSLPGFLPKEIYSRLDIGGLKSSVCQRCYLLKHHNVALHVRVSPDIYPKLLEPIKREKALVVVVIDLLDMPCSIWPDLIDIVGTKRPVILVGNKVDLLPADGVNHLRRVKDAMLSAVNKTSLGKANIIYATLISAHTGFGIERLITKIQKTWANKGDIYLVGCTNTGKSTLFNALLGSDMCKVQASDFILRATTSPWPGTTLNMLKFPLLRPSGYRLFQRLKRLKHLEKELKLKDKSQKGAYAPSVMLATLSGPIGKTFASKEPDEGLDPFSSKFSSVPKDSQKAYGIKESKEDYVHGKWCYDTPGTVQPDQMINLLTHEELMKVLPRELIQPCTYSMKTGLTLFVGGLARLDLLYSCRAVRFTVYTSPDVPVTIVRTVDASAFCRKYLGTPLLGVPFGNDERLQYWPALMPHNLHMTGLGLQESCADVVLSSAGWVAITGRMDHDIDLRGWTPGGRGIYLRRPCILPYAITLKGNRIQRTPAYKPHKLIIPGSNV